MRRLSRGRRSRWSVPGPLARLRSEERGGIAVMLVLLMPILFGAAAIAIDSAAVWSARQQVLSGADAAVLAVATDCALGDCGDIKETAEDAFFANDLAAKVSNLGTGEGWIAVNGRKISVTQKRPWEVNHFFAGALGFDTGELSVSSYAQWAPIAKVQSEVPIALSYCTYQQAARTLGSNAIVRLGAGGFTGNSCRAPDGRTLSAGFSLTRSDSAACGTTTARGGTYQVSTGSLPSSCNAALGTLTGTDITIPVWDYVSGSSYRVYGYAAFRVTAVSTYGGGQLTGYFTRSARQVDDTTPPDTTAPDLGARAVFLTEN